MRGELNFNMLPIVPENINDIAYNPTINHGITNIPSSNGYYGFQPNFANKIGQNHNNSNHMVEEGMQVDHNAGHGFEFVQKVLFVNNSGSRKRALPDSCTNNEFRYLKKKRESAATQQNCIDDNAKKKIDKTSTLLEDLLSGTHGCPIYHWPSKDQ